MSELRPEAEPAELGLDPGRLHRIDRHFARYVDDGRLPGWLITLSSTAASLTVSFFTQLLPSSAYPIRPQLRQLVYQALAS